MTPKSRFSQLNRGFLRAPASLLLVGAGVLLGTGLITGRLAIDRIVAPMAWAFWTTLITGVVLSGIALLKRNADQGCGGNIRKYLRYSLIAGVVSIGLPTVILFTVIDKLGAGLTGTFYALPNLLTLTFAWLFRVERLDLRRLGGMSLGFLGAAAILVPPGNLPSSELFGWLLLALLIPVSLAVGNLYRSLAWPQGASAVAAAASSTLAGAGWILLASLAIGEPTALLTIGNALDLLFLQAALGSASLALHFRVQQVTGPVFSSQIGYIATATALAAGALLLDEHYSALVLFGSFVISAGVAVVATAPALNQAAIASTPKETSPC